MRVDLENPSLLPSGPMHGIVWIKPKRGSMVSHASHDLIRTIQLPPEAPMMPAHAHLLDTWFEVLDHGTEAEAMQLVDQLFAPDYVCHMAAGDVIGRDGLKAHTSGSYAIFGDMEHRILENFGDGDLLATRVLFSAVHTGEFLGMAATGARIECPIIYLHRFANGLIQEAWLDWDSLMLLSQRISAAAVTGNPIDA